MAAKTQRFCPAVCARIMLWFSSDVRGHIVFTIIFTCRSARVLNTLFLLFSKDQISFLNIKNIKNIKNLFTFMSSHIHFFVHLLFLMAACRRWNQEKMEAGRIHRPGGASGRLHPTEGGQMDAGYSTRWGLPWKVQNTLWMTVCWL